MATILVVDDSAVDRRLVGGVIERSSNHTVEYATNGAEALDKIRWSVPDVVVTDLQMPEIDGLQLVKRIRTLHERLPVILITAHGSEGLAIKALAQGAASYVPKSMLPDRLAQTVDQVLRLTLEQPYNDLINCLAHFAYTFVLDNDPALIPPLIDLAQRFIATVGLCDATETMRVGLALEEALWNAVFHGNLEMTSELDVGAARSNARLLDERRRQEPYRNRRVTVDVNMSPSSATFVIRDEGPGFDTSSLPDWHDTASWDQRAGRGLRLMGAFMEEVTFNSAGNEVTMIKRLKAYDFDVGAEKQADDD